MSIGRAGKETGSADPDNDGDIVENQQIQNIGGCDGFCKAYDAGASSPGTCPIPRSLRRLG
jgi:hypothetical protein